MNFDDIVGGEEWPEAIADVRANTVEPWAVPRAVTEAELAAAICREIEANAGWAHIFVEGRVCTPETNLNMHTNPRHLARMLHRVAVDLGIVAS